MKIDIVKRKAAANKILKANKSIEKTRVDLTAVLKTMLGKRKHDFIFNDRVGETMLISIEEEGEMFATGVDKDVVFLKDGTTADLGDVNTDDLHTLVEKVYCDIYVPE